MVRDFTIPFNTNGLGLRSNAIKDLCPLILHQLVVGWIDKAHGLTSGRKSSKHNVLWIKCISMRWKVFQKIDFSRFSIDWICLSTDRKCDKNLGYNLPGSIASQLMLDQSNVFFDWSNLIFDRTKIIQSFLKQAFLTCSSLYSNFSKSFLLSLSLFNRSSSSDFLLFSSKFFSRFLSFCAGKTFLPFIFHFIHIFHAFFTHFKGIFRTYRNLGSLIFELIYF